MKKFVVVICVLAMVATVSGQTFISTQPGKSNVLIEEYTGVACQYCPLGHKTVDQTLAAFPGKAFAINIHQGTFATKFTTQWGNALAQQARVTGYPSATLNRHAFSSNSIQINPGQAYPFAMQALEEPSPVNVAATVDLDPATRLMVVKVEVYYTGNSMGDFDMLNVALVQNNVLAQQTGGSTYYPENMVNGQYRHNHILRHLLTGQWGDTIPHPVAGTFFTKEYAYVVPQRINDLDIANLDDLSVLVFVCEDRTEVLNVCEAIRISDKAYMAYGNGRGEECSMDYAPNVVVVNPTGKTIGNLRFDVDGRQVVRDKNIQPYCTDTVQLLSYSIDEMPAEHENYEKNCSVRFMGYTTDGATVNLSGETMEIKYANADIYTSEGPLTLSVKYDDYPDEVTVTLAGVSDCQFYYNINGQSADRGKTINYTLSPATAGLYRMKIFDVGGDGLNGTVTVTDPNNNILFSRNGKDLMCWDNVYFNITTDGVDGPIGTVVGIDETADEQEWSVYPNPVCDVLHISVPTLLNAEVMDMTGRLLMCTGGQEVNVSALPDGVYLLRIVTTEGVDIRRFVKVSTY